MFLLLIACGGKTSVAPTSPTILGASSSTSTPLSTSPTFTQLILRPDRIPGYIGEPQQFKAIAVFSDRSERDVTIETMFQSSDSTIADISPTGLLRPIRPGVADIRGIFQGTEVKYSIEIRWAIGKAPGELYGQLREAGSDSPLIPFGEVEIVGGDYNGRLQRVGSDFLFTGINSAGFDLIARSVGYQPTRYHVAEVPARITIELQPQPSLLSEVLDASVCPQHPATRSFKTSGGGIFRLTAVRFGYYEGGPGVQVLLRGGVPARPSNFDDRVYEFPPGTEFELRISLDWDCTTFHVNYLRPRL